MPSQTEIAFVTAAGMLDAINALLNTGTGDAIINIYEGTIPADCETAEAGTLLGTCVMNATPFIAAANQNPGARLVANAIVDDSAADATGEAQYFRVYSSNSGTDASKLVCYLQGSAGVSGDTPDLTLDNKNIVIGGTISCTAYTIDMPES
jgi:hypothetical protein